INSASKSGKPAQAPSEAQTEQDRAEAILIARRAEMAKLMEEESVTPSDESSDTKADTAA
ncbi:hypothetical protein JYU04_03070, partial [Dehalococcoides mccartyi]|nr:hypothetical protein [Dehalococcoides mccartyi]